MKKIVLPAIILVAFLLTQILDPIIFYLYNNNLDMEVPKVLGSYWLVWGLIKFTLSTAFYVIVFIYFRKYKLLVIFSISVLVTSFSFSLYLGLRWLDVPDFLVRLFATLSFFGGMANILIAFIIILSEKFDKWVCNSLLLFGLVIYIDGSYYTGFLKGILVGIFGPFRGATLILEVYEFFFMAVYLLIAILQGLIIRGIMYHEEYGDKDRKRLVM